MSGDREFTGPTPHDLADYRDDTSPMSLEDLRDGVYTGKTYQLDGREVASEGYNGKLKLVAYELSQREERALLLILISRSLGQEFLPAGYCLEDAVFSLRLDLHRTNPQNKAQPF